VNKTNTRDWVGRTVEFVAVWSLAAALVLCPWVSAAALSDNGEFAQRTAGWLWRACLGALFVGTVAFAAFLERKIGKGKSVRQVIGAFAIDLAVTLTLLIVSFIAADAALARVKPLPVAAHLDVPNAQLYGWAFAPFQTILFGNPDTGEIIRERANSAGWRDVEHALWKSRPRLLLLGDSQVFGSGVPFDQTIGRHLQRLLGDRCEVIAIGIGGWGTDQELLFLENEGWTYHPDIVVLMFTMGNDVLNNMYDHALFGTGRKPTFRLEGENLELESLPESRPSALRRLFGHSMICRYFRFRQQVRRFNLEAPLPSQVQTPIAGSPFISYDPSLEDMAHDYSHHSIFGETWSARLAQAWRLTLRLIQEMDRRCRSHNAALILYPYGQPWTPSPVLAWFNRGKTYRLDFEKPFRLLREFCEREGIAYLEEPPEFRLANVQGLLRFRSEGHLNAEGSRRAAENIARWVEENDPFGRAASLAGKQTQKD